MLLLYAVRMVRTGIERSYGASFQRVMTGQRSYVQASMVGVAMAIVLQSSAAVALLASGFAASGMLAFPAGLAIVLGGDLGSALIIQVLSFQLDWLVPLLLAVGGYLFVKTEAKKARQLGRILMGVAFILISLRFLREAMDPIRDSAFLPAIADYLARDYITAFLVGGGLAFVMHSSVAAILMCVTLVQIDAIPFAAGAVFGAGREFRLGLHSGLADARDGSGGASHPLCQPGPAWHLGCGHIVCREHGAALQGCWATRKADRCWSMRIWHSMRHCWFWPFRSAASCGVCSNA